MAKRLILFFIVTTFIVNAHAQSILLERDINESVYVKQKGPNKKRFTHLYYDFGLYMPTESNQLYQMGYSFRNFMGIRNYYRVTNTYIMGFNLEFGWENFRVKQEIQKTFPAPGIHKKEILSTSNLGLEYFNRLLISKRGTSLGTWIDAGFYGNLNLGSRHVTKDKSELTDQMKYHKEIDKGLKYVNVWEYGLKARLGLKRYALTGSYRLSNWISGLNNSYEPPQLSIGLEVGLY